jgi:hypothetical protein
MRVSRSDDTGQKSIRSVEIAERADPLALAALSAHEVRTLR